MSELQKAILGVMGEIGYVHKSGRVSGGGMNYSFAGEAAMLKSIRPSMVRHSLTMMPVGCVLHETHEEVPTKYGPKMSRTVRIVSTYRLTHVSGESVDLMSVGEGMDSGDKAAAKAMTIALKYCLKQAFLIETGDDPDRERPEALAEAAAEAEHNASQEACRKLSRLMGATTAEEADALVRDVSSDALTWRSVATDPAAVLTALRARVAQTEARDAAERQ